MQESSDAHSPRVVLRLVDFENGQKLQQFNLALLGGEVGRSLLDEAADDFKASLDRASSLKEALAQKVSHVCKETLRAVARL